MKKSFNSSFFAAAVAMLVIPTLFFQVLYGNAAANDEQPITYPVTYPDPTESPEPTNTPESTSNQNNNAPSGGSSNDSQPSNGGGSSSAPSCNDAKPGSTPYLMSAQVLKANKVLLTWSKVQSPVTHYSVVFGVKPGQALYGNSNVGNTNSYIVNDLSPKAVYYFKVRANNGCNGSELSNEVSSKPSKITPIKVLGKGLNKIVKTQPMQTQTPTPASTNTPKVNSGWLNSLNSAISSKLSGFFN